MYYNNIYMYKYYWCRQYNVDNNTMVFIDLEKTHDRDVGNDESTSEELDVGEMRMLRWMSGVTKLDRIRNERIKAMPHVTNSSTISLTIARWTLSLQR